MVHFTTCCERSTIKVSTQSRDGCLTLEHIIIASTRTDVGNYTGLVSSHCYSLISVHQLSTGPKLVYLRNPWGSKEWDGDWSDNSSKWTPALRAEVRSAFGDHVTSVQDDGAFWMSYDDMLRHFETIYVNMCRVPGVCYCDGA